jgi:death-on-curing protein
MNRRLLDATGGGLFGVRDPHRLAYLVEIVRDDRLFPTLWAKAAMYLQRLAVSQAFIDGNKRTALASALVFLGLNGYVLNEPSQAKVESFMVEVALKKHSLPQVRRWLRSRATRIQE